MAHWKNFALVSWQGRADAQAVRDLVGFADQLIPTYGMFTVIHVIGLGAGLPTPDGRDEFITSIRAKGRQHLACVGVLLPDSPIVAAMLQTFARASRTLLRGELETVVEHDRFALGRGVMKIHESRTNVRARTTELVEAVDELMRISRSAEPADDTGRDACHRR